MLGQLIGDSRPTLGSKGSTKDQKQGRSEPSLARTWLLAVDPPASAGDADQADDVLAGESLLAARLVVFLPGNVTEFGPVIEGLQEEVILMIDRFRSEAATPSRSSKTAHKAEPKRKRKQTPRSGSDRDRPSVTTVPDRIDSIDTDSGRPKLDLNNIPE